MGIGAAAMLLASTMGMEATTASVADASVSQSGRQDELSKQAQNARQAAKPVVKVGSLMAKFTSKPAQRNIATSAEVSTEIAAVNSFEVAKSLGWQAALKGQNPPHSAQHWAETADLWRRAIAHLNQVPKRDRSYDLVRPKLTFYQNNLKEIESRQASAARENALQARTSAPSVSEAMPQFSSQLSFQSAKAGVAEGDYLVIARQQGWQAAQAGQNAPHRTKEWANIARIWKAALLNLDQISPEHPQYAEAQQVKAEYQENLEIVRQRYRQEQSAGQSVASLQAALSEMERLGLSGQTKRTQAQAIRHKLRLIPAGTVAYKEAQKIVSRLNSVENGIAIATSAE